MRLVAFLIALFWATAALAQGVCPSPGCPGPNYDQMTLGSPAGGLLGIGNINVAGGFFVNGVRIGSGAGNITGPNSSTSGTVPIWNNSSGTALSDGGNSIIPGTLAVTGAGTFDSLTLGAATSGNQGTGTINATGIFLNGVSIGAGPFLPLATGGTVTGATTFSGGIAGTLTGGASLDLPLAGGTVTGATTFSFSGGALTTSTGSNASLGGTLSVAGAIAQTTATDQAQASGGSVSLAFASTTGIAVGQTVKAASVPLGDQVASIVSTAQVSQTTNGSFLSGQKVVPFTVTTGYAVGQQCTDTTGAGVIGAGNLIASIQAGVSITLTANALTNSIGFTDTIVCDPVATLRTATTATVGAAASIAFYANQPSVSASSVIYDQADASIVGNLNAGGNASIGGTLGVTGVATLSGGGTFSGTFTGTPTWSGLNFYTAGLTVAGTVPLAANVTNFGRGVSMPWSGTVSAWPLLVSTNLTGTATAGVPAAAYIAISNDTADITGITDGTSSGLEVIHQYGGATAGGGHIGVFGDLVQLSQTSDGGGGNVALYGIAESRATEGGTTGLKKGEMWGLNTISRLGATSTNFAYIYGYEADMQVYSGSSVANRVGISVNSSGGSDAVQGSQTDAAYAMFQAYPNSYPGWTTGFQFGGGDSRIQQFPIDNTNGTLIEVARTFNAALVLPSSAPKPVKAKAGIDFSALETGSFLLGFPGGTIGSDGGFYSGGARFGSTSTGASLDLPNETVTAATVAAGGDFAFVGDRLYDTNGGIYLVATISGHAVATVTILFPGVSASPPSNPVAVSGLSAAGVTLNLTWAAPTTLALGTTSATAINIGNSGSTTAFAGTLKLATSSTGAGTATFTNSPCTTSLTTEQWIPVQITGQSGTWYVPACH